MVNVKTPKRFLEEVVAPACNNSKEILKAFEDVPRELFLDDVMKRQAYLDKALPIGLGQSLSQPSLVAHMLFELDLDENDNILEIGSGSGFLTALLAKIVKNVYAVELLPQLLEIARKRLRSLKITNARFKCDNGRNGWQEYAPFDKIVASAGSKDLPEELLNQLKIGGILLIPVNDKLMKYVKGENGASIETGLNVNFVPLA